MTALAATVRDNEAAHRYELLVDEERVGELIYRARDGVVTLIHTEIAPQFEGHGLGDQLVALRAGRHPRHAVSESFRCARSSPRTFGATPSTRTSSSE